MISLSSPTYLSFNATANMRTLICIVLFPRFANNYAFCGCSDVIGVASAADVSTPGRGGVAGACTLGRGFSDDIGFAGACTHGRVCSGGIGVAYSGWLGKCCSEVICITGAAKFSLSIALCPSDSVPSKKWSKKVNNREFILACGNWPNLAYLDLSK